ncbi:hypothetical protein ABIB66_006662 [Bradyrhizobium sp. F1.13.3]
MSISMLDQMLFKLPCGHKVVLGRLFGAKDWTCELCHQKIELSSGPCKAAFEKDLEKANLVDLLEKARGNKVTRLS